MSVKSLVIHYKTPGSRSFARPSTEDSLEKTKTLVREKFGVGHETLMELTYQLRDEETILDDDDDFEAFKTHIKALSLTIVIVEVTILENSPLSRNLAKKDTPKNGKEHSDGPSDAQIHIDASAPASRKRHVSPDDDGDTLVGSSPVKPSASHEFSNPSHPKKRIRIPRKKQRV